MQKTERAKAKTPSRVKEKELVVAFAGHTEKWDIIQRIVGEFAMSKYLLLANIASSGQTTSLSTTATSTSGGG